MTNRRLLLDSLGTFRFEENPIPEPPEGAVVVKIAYAGICHSDAHMAYTLKFHPKFIFPRVLGHEISGTVHKLSEKAREERPDLAQGDKVMVFPWGNCHNCKFCQGNCSYCETAAYGKGPVDSYVYGVWRDGGYQNYVVVDIPSFLLKVPDTISMNQACLIPCSGVTSYNAAVGLRESMERSKRIKGTAIVGVVGAGGLGLWAIQIIKALYLPGVKVVAVDISQEKLDDAKVHGADIVHKWGKDEPAQEAVDGLIKACGARLDGVIDFIGAPSVVERSFLSLNLGGTLNIVGLSGINMPQMTLNSVVRRNVIVRGTIVGSLPQLEVLVAMVKDGRVKPPPVQEVSMEEIEGTLQRIRKAEQRGRAVIKM